MRAVVVHSTEEAARRARQIVLGAGLECSAQDSISFDKLPPRLAQGGADLFVIGCGDDPQAALDAVSRASHFTSAPVMVFGAMADTDLARRAMTSGAAHYLDESNMRDALDSALANLAGAGAGARRRSAILSVFAPTAGSGGTTVSANLAGALARTRPDEVALIELAEQGGLALRLDVEPACTVQSLCQHWDRMDKTNLASSLTRHASGVRVLTHPVDDCDTFLDPLSCDAVHRMGVLLRGAFPISVFKLESAFDDPGLEAMRMSDNVVLVVRPDVPAVRRAKRALRLAEAEGVSLDRFRLVVNRWGQPGQLGRAQIREALDLPIFELLPEDAKLTNLAANRGVMLHELSRMAGLTRRFGRLASRLMESK